MSVPWSCGWTANFEQLQYPFFATGHNDRCGWTANFEQLQSRTR